MAIGCCEFFSSLSMSIQERLTNFQKALMKSISLPRIHWKASPASFSPLHLFFSQKQEKLREFGLIPTFVSLAP